ncbi:MAG: site-specific integrase, partial [Proteobacteria bacterium]|nr:site-specific integrase [Pseudomonadota bacterium]
RDVKTKFSKSFTTGFFPVGDEVRDIVVHWVEFLQSDLHMSSNAPLFPKTKMQLGSDHAFETAGLSAEHWSTAAPIRKIFKAAFAVADLPNYNPHSFRNTLAAVGERLCQTAEEFKSWSQNLGHEGVLTTFYSYGEVQTVRQVELIQGLGMSRGKTGQGVDAEEIAEAVLRRMGMQTNG